MSTQPFNKSDILKLIIFLTLIFVFMLTAKADTVPYPWFDEGWTLTTARNWVEQGKYALHLGDQWVSAETMTQSFTVTVPIAISFKIFGVGLLSGRLPGILYTIGMLAWMFAIAKQLYGDRVAWATVFAILVFPSSLQFQPLIVGRQALGEIPMLFFLLGGYWFLFQTLNQPRKFYFILGASVFWGMAIITKRQPIPFWLVSVLLPLLLTFKNKDYQTTKLLGLMVINTGIFALLFTFIENSLLASAPLYGAPVSASYLRLLAWNADPTIRFITAQNFVYVGIFPVLGIVYFLNKNVAHIKSKAQLPPNTWVELSLWTLTCSWTLWYLGGSWGWFRYYMPAYLICWLFFAKALYDQTEGLNWKKTLNKLSTLISKDWQQNLSQLITILLLAILVVIAWINISGLLSILKTTNRSFYDLADYIHANISQTAIIETYESELLFILPNRPMHFPSHQIQEELNRHTFLNENIVTSYDPLAANPDLLIIGSSGKSWQLYDTILKETKFKLVAQIGQYDVYQRVR